MTARAFIVLLIGMLVPGCATTPEPADHVRGPSETAEFYLSNFYRSSMAKDLYQCLAPAARRSLPYADFLLGRQRELDGAGLGNAHRIVRVQAAVLDGFRVNDRHHVLYVLQQVRFPYTGGRDNHYRLLRLHVVNERNGWYVEPFVDERTRTVRLLPALKRDALYKLYDHREAIARIIADDIEAMRAGRIRPLEEVATDTGVLEIPDLAEELKPIPGARAVDSPAHLRALLDKGKLHYRAGQLDQAEAAFTRVLELDPLNATAQAYLDRVRRTRELQKEKQETIKLIEQILEADETSEPD